MYLVTTMWDLLNVFFCSLKMHDESTSRQKVDDDVQEGAIPPYLLDRDQTQRAKVHTLLLPPTESQIHTNHSVALLADFL